MNLDEFITKCSGEGELESEGSFSVDSLGALRKTLASALPEPHFYLFQLLQPLIQAKSSDIKVAIGRRENRISFQDTNQVFSDLDALEGKFQKGLSVASNNPLELIMSGLVTSLGCHVSSAELHYGHQKLAVTVDGLSRTKLVRETPPVLVLRRSLEKGLSYSWSRIWGARKEEFRIRKAFEHSPIPVSIAGLDTVPRAGWRRGIEGDGKLALAEVAVLALEAPNHRGESQEKLKRVDGEPRLYVCEPARSTPEGTDLAVAPNLFMMACDDEGAPLEQDLTEKAWQKRRWTVCFTNCGNEKAAILFVRNGLSVERQEIDFKLPGLHLVAPADDLSVDATGYKLVRNEALQKRIEEAKWVVFKAQESLQKLPLAHNLQNLGQDPERLRADFPWLESVPLEAETL
jgi:hypothetical protein